MNETNSLHPLFIRAKILPSNNLIFALIGRFVYSFSLKLMDPDCAYRAWLVMRGPRENDQPIAFHYYLQFFKNNISLFDKGAIGELLIVTNCTEQIKEMIINCERRLDKSEKTNTSTVEVYTSTIAHRDR